MTNEEYRLKKGTLDYICELAGDCCYTQALTLTMKQRRKVMTERGVAYLKLTRVDAAINLHHFVNILNRALYKNAAKPKRGNKSVSLLGALHVGTLGNNLHFHCVIGRFPNWLTDEACETLIRSAWLQTHFGNKQIVMKQLATTGWMEYMVNELGTLSDDTIEWASFRN